MDFTEFGRGATPPERAGARRAPHLRASSDQYPAGLAPVLARGRSRAVDLDGLEYVDPGWGCVRSRSVTRTPGRRGGRAGRGRRGELRAAVVLELRAAERFLEQVPTADMVKFAKNGSDATTAALRLARAATGRELVAICRDQPFFSVDDWFIGTPR